MRFNVTSNKVDMETFGDKDRRGYIVLHEKNIQGFKWYLTQKEVDYFFEGFNNENKWCKYSKRAKEK